MPIRDAFVPPVLALLALALAACESTQKKPETEAPVAEQAIALREAPAAQVLPPSLAGAALDGAARAALSEPNRALVDGSRLPVLLPRKVAGQGRLLVEEHWYDFAWRGNDLEVHVKGIGVSHTDLPFPRTNETIAGREVFVNKSEGIVSASFRAHGIHYDVSIECGGRVCDDSSEMRAMIADLVLVGGGVR